MEENREGRPPKYKTHDELEKGIELYFEELKVYDAEDVFIRERPPTTAGLAYHLGYADRQSLYDQKGRSDEFSCAIKKALLYIESYHEGNLTDGKQPTGSIFWLKNHKWTDKQEVEIGRSKNINTSNLTEEQKEALIALGNVTSPDDNDDDKQ